MKQLYLCAFLCVFTVNAQQFDVSDVNFEQALIDRGIDQGTPDGVIDYSRTSTVTYLDVSNSNITSLSGIEAFTNLISLDASNNAIKTADFARNTGITELILHNNELESLNVANNSALQKLNLYKNKLTHIYLLGNTALTYLAVADNYLSELNVSANVNLEKLFCQNNQIASLNVSNMPALKLVNAQMNNLSSLQVLNSGSLSQIVANNNYLTALDVSTNPELESVNVLFNTIRSMDFSHNTSLTNVLLANNNLESLNIRNGHNDKLITLRVENNPNLSCITADDTIVTNEGSESARWNKDYNTMFSADCTGLAVQENADQAFTVFIDTNRTLNINSTRKGFASIYNLQGIPVISKDISEGNQSIAMDKFINSVYVLHITSEEGKFSKKFVLH